VFALLAACSFRMHEIGSDAPPPIDDAPRSGDARWADAYLLPDGPIADAPIGCDGAGTFVVCLTAPQANPLMLSDTVVNTDDCLMGEKLAQVGGPALCVLSGTTVSIGGVVRADGTLPLALLATDSLDIAAGAMLDVSSSRATGSGAGADPADCTTVDGGANFLGGGGGAGGSFGTAGGNGGPGAGGASSASSASAPPIVVRGGCAGGKGGDGMAFGGAGGFGGGAVYLLARNVLTIDGSVDASGAGGTAPAASKNGGGAGGSGGMIVLWAGGSLTITGQLYANGGAGAGGSEMQPGTSGGESAGASDAATGGLGGGMTGNGGNGAISTQTGGAGTHGSKGGGGGGGGVGWLRNLSGQSLGGALSPPPI
jgi:hypothetical protein